MLERVVKTMPGKYVEVRNESSTTTGDNIVASGAEQKGHVIDRKDLGRHYVGVQPFAQGVGAASTGADQRVGITLSLEHGDQADGSDMAAWQEERDTPEAVYYTAEATEDYTSWTTGDKTVTGHGAYYDLRGAKQYVRAVCTVTNRTGTLLKAYTGLAFWDGTEAPPRVPPAYLSTSTGA